MIEGITHTPTQADSHAELQSRNGLTVAAMRDEIEKKDNKIKAFHDSLAQFIVITSKLEAENDRLTAENEALKKELYQVRNHWSQYNNAFFLRVRNALAYLRLVNTSNVNQAYINCAKLELEDIDKRRGANAP